MPKIAYIERRFHGSVREMIDAANTIIGEYQAAGYDLTLRQLYYQFVSRALIANSLKEYKRLGETISNGRLAGLIDWDAVVDRTRALHRLSTWSTPADILEACVSSYRIDAWRDQPNYVEVWVEKEALAGVFERVCDELRVPVFCCRGYTSQSEMWAAAQRLRHRVTAKKVVTILHFGDHDPSGLDMTRDIEERLSTFNADVCIRRVALNRDQVDQYNPPPNPAKQTDARFAAYERDHGDESWELDALDPTVLAQLVRDQVEPLLSRRIWNQTMRREEADRDRLRNAAHELRD